jgi:alpha/beta superfamily hydrolase
VEPIRFSTEDGISIEGELRMPEDRARGSAVICHAHPRHGGSKDHPILWAVRNELAHRGLAVLAFNFRGTMGSSGAYGGGRTEVKDVAAAIGRVRTAASGPTVMAGWSFGANVGLREALEDERVSALALIALPLASPKDVDVPALPTIAELRLLRRPVLLLAGDADAYCPADVLGRFAADLPNARVEILAGTDHYLWRREKEAAQIVGEFADALLDAPS